MLMKLTTELRSKMSFSVKNFKQLNHPVCYQVYFVQNDNLKILIKTFSRYYPLKIDFG